MLVWSLFSFSFSPLVQNEEEDKVEITNPLTGEAVQGLVQIIGTINVSGLDYFKLEFSSQNSQAQTWFLINEQEQGVSNDIIGEWDTSILTDGTYILRLSVLTLSDEPIVRFVEGIRIRNYTQIETNTPTATSNIISPTATEEDIPTLAPSLPPPPSSTPLRENPASINQETLTESMIVGGIIGGLGSILLFLYVIVRQRR